MQEKKLLYAFSQIEVAPTEFNMLFKAGLYGVGAGYYVFNYSGELTSHDYGISIAAGLGGFVILGMAEALVRGWWADEVMFYRDPQYVMGEPIMGLVSQVYKGGEWLVNQTTGFHKEVLHEAKQRQSGKGDGK